VAEYQDAISRESSENRSRYQDLTTKIGFVQAEIQKGVSAERELSRKFEQFQREKILKNFALKWRSAPVPSASAP